MLETIKRKRGRPLKGPAKNNKITIRLTELEIEELRNASKKYGISQTDILRKGLMSQLNLLKYQNSD